MGGETPPPSSGKQAVPPVLKRPEDEVPEGFSRIPPKLPANLYQFYLPTEYNPEMSVRHWEVRTGQYARNVDTRKRLLYRPALLAQGLVRFDQPWQG